MTEDRTDDTAEQLVGHRQRWRTLADQIGELGFISRGSVTLRHTRCGKASCRCQADPPQPHGPYYQWTRKVAGKTVTRRLSQAQAALYQEWITNNRRLEAIIAQMEDVSRQAAELLLDRQRSD